MASDGLDFAEAIESVRAGSVFTTHTPVPAGIDRFPRELMQKYFAGWAADAGIGMDELLGLGPGARRPTSRRTSTWRSWGSAWPPGPTAWPSSTAR